MRIASIFIIFFFLIACGSKSGDGFKAIESVISSSSVTIDTETLLNITEANIANFRASGSCSENGESVTVNVGGVIANPAPNCTNGAWEINIDLSRLGASRVITLTADHAKSDGSLAATQAMEMVTLYPRVSIDSEALEDITGANIEDFRVSGSCSENEEPITVNVGGGIVTPAPHCINRAWAVNIDVSRLGASREITITADHASSGFSLLALQAEQSVTLYPRVTIDIEALEDITSFNAASFRVSGSCSENGEPVTVSVGDVVATPTPNCITGAWTADINVSELTGASVTTSITAGHSTSGDSLEATQATASVILNPPLSITRALEDITSSNAASFRVSGHCSENGEPVTVSVGGVMATPAPNCTAGSWTTDLDVTSLNKRQGEISVTADHSPDGGPAHPQATTSVTNTFICPENYVGVPELASYTTNSFCVMKYEAKSDGSTNSNAVSQARNTPYVNINQEDSISKCTAIGGGYDLITNNEWQSLARNIELVGDNWATGSVGNAGGLSTGHTDRSPNTTLPAHSFDSVGCHGTEQNCDSNTWNSQRRTHTLSNGEIIWDVSGNVWEWVKDINTVAYYMGNQDVYEYFSEVTSLSHPILGALNDGTTTTSRVIKDQFGPSGDYTALNSGPHGGLGFLTIEPYLYGGVIRGGYNSTGGVFETDLALSRDDRAQSVGFRCVYHP